MTTLVIDNPPTTPAAADSRLASALRDPDYRHAEGALLAWLLAPDYADLEALAPTLIERDARRLGHLLDLLLHFELAPILATQRVHRVLDDLRDRIGIDHDQPLDERWNADRTFDPQRLAQRMAVGP